MNLYEWFLVVVVSLIWVAVVIVVWTGWSVALQGGPERKRVDVDELRNEAFREGVEYERGRITRALAPKPGIKRRLVDGLLRDEDY